MGDLDDVNVTDQDGMTAEETKALQDMEAADGASDDGGGAPAPKPAAKKPAGKKPAAQAAPQTGDEGEGDEGGDEGQGQQQQNERNRTVPLAALHESRAEIKKLRDQAALDAQRFQTLEQRTNLILERMAPKKEEPKADAIPDMNEDPVGWIAATMKQTGKTLEDVQTQLAGYQKRDADQAEATKQRTALNSIISQAAKAETEFTKTNPDYDAAGAFLHQSRVEELQEIGYSDEEVAAIIQNEKLAIAQKAFADGKNPASVVYNMAKRRGYKKPDAEESDEADAPAKKLETLKKGQEQGQSLSSARGQGPSPMTVARLLEMSDAAFDAWSEKHPDEARNLMGQ